MKAYSIFDDYTEEAKAILSEAGVKVTMHPSGVHRPDHEQMKIILESYDCVIIGTSQKITEDMFDNINTPRIIATASVGVDHINIPTEMRSLVTIINTPKANAQSVAEYTIACALTACKRLNEGGQLYLKGKDNKQLYKKPEDLNGKIMGVVGAGNISVKIMEYARFFGMRILCWTAHPENHRDLQSSGVSFTDLDSLLCESDVISVNLPNNTGTKNLISKERVSLIKSNATFISVSRRNTLDIAALIKRAESEPGFHVFLDLDVDMDIVKSLPERPNILITPHIAGGTVETRKRMFREVAEKIASLLNRSDYMDDNII